MSALPKSLDVVYTVSDNCGEVLFAERATAEKTAKIWRAVMDSKTWGEFKDAMPPAEWSEAVEPLDGDIPPDKSPFSSDDVPGWGDDGWYIGPWPLSDVLDWFPDNLIDKYECQHQATPNGLNLYIPAESAEAIVAELRARGGDFYLATSGDFNLAIDTGPPRRGIDS